jgi:hypothetical protein
MLQLWRNQLGQQLGVCIADGISTHSAARFSSPLMPVNPPTYRYWHDKGFVTIILSRVLNICALAFTIAFSGFLLLAVNWGALHAECIVKDTCDITAAALYAHPLQAQGIVWGALSLTYLAIFTLYWLWTVVHFVADLRDLLELKHFVNNKLGISERQVKMMTWSELVHRIVLLQRTTRCAPAPADTCTSNLHLLPASKAPPGPLTAL